MRTEKEKQKLRTGITLAAIGIVIALAGCVGAYPPQAPQGQYQNGYYSYDDYPNTYRYYDNDGQPYRSGYSDDPDLRYDAQERDSSHSDDHNFHNRDDFDHWDY